MSAPDKRERSQSWALGPTDAPPAPVLAGLPLLGSTLDLLRGPLKVVMRGYHEHGSIFRIKALGRCYTVLAGTEANRMVIKLGDNLLAEPEYHAFAEGMGTDNFVLSMDGPRHKHMRAVLKRGYSKSAIRPHIGMLVDSTRAEVGSWRPGQVIDIIPILKRLVTRQIGIALMGREPGGAVEDLQIFISTTVKCKLTRSHPAFLLRMPRYTGAIRRLRTLSREIAEDHRRRPPSTEPNIIDDLFAAVDMEGEPFAEDAAVAVVIGTFLAGLDTVAIATSFVLYNLLRYPEVLARVKAEVDEAFAGSSTLSVDALKGMHALHATILETLRMYPILAFVTREAKETFEFAGHRVDAGDKLMLAPVVPHFLAEHFPSPETFDIDRYILPRREHQRPGVYAPFGVGPHICLGAGMAEVQLMVLLATIVRYVRLEYADPNYVLKVILDSSRRPDRKFKLRLSEHRQTP